MTFAELHRAILEGRYADDALIYQDGDLYYVGERRGFFVGTVGQYRERWGM